MYKLLPRGHLQTILRQENSSNGMHVNDHARMSFTSVHNDDADFSLKHRTFLFAFSFVILKVSLRFKYILATQPTHKYPGSPSVNKKLTFFNRKEEKFFKKPC